MLALGVVARGSDSECQSRSERERIRHGTGVEVHRGGHVHIAVHIEICVIADRRLAHRPAGPDRDRGCGVDADIRQAAITYHRRDDALESVLGSACNAGVKIDWLEISRQQRDDGGLEYDMACTCRHGEVEGNRIDAENRLDRAIVEGGEEDLFSVFTLREHAHEEGVSFRQTPDRGVATRAVDGPGAGAEAPGRAA